ncbi:MAG: ABC transporter ATP-binding protein [Candidatus Omnitrophota bacterium]|nr:ABC transporter ATP-binding protein [Candidatus Omnitrophota bacterium]
MPADNLLRIENLKVNFSESAGSRQVINGLSLAVNSGEILALVGSSGSGKTLTGLSILRLLPIGANLVGGKIIFKQQDLLQISESQMREVRGRNISMVFQEPLSALNPLFTIGSQIKEVLRFRTELGKNEIEGKALDLLKSVGMPDPKKIINDYPHQLSGGLRQRAMIAQAIAAGPELLIADEPTSNLDVTLQAQIMELFRTLKKELNLAILLITHDLAMVSHLADRVAIICEGKIVEFGQVANILQQPRNPFTQALVEAVKL